jgi:hypothetical protein
MRKLLMVWVVLFFAPVLQAQDVSKGRFPGGRIDIVGRDLDGKSFSLSDYRGNVVMLVFWGEW